MPLYTADALVLRTYKLAEADRIVVFLTADRGKKRGVAKSARRPRSRFVASLEPLTHVRVAYFEKETRELVSLNYAELVRSPLSASGDALVYASYFAELIDEWAPADDPNETLYRLGTSVLEAMAEGIGAEVLARYFEYWLLRLQGVYAADPQASSAALAFLGAARSCSPLALAGVAAPPAVLRELEASHRELIAMHLEKELRSVRVLREMRR